MKVEKGSKIYNGNGHHVQYQSVESLLSARISETEQELKKYRAAWTLIQLEKIAPLDELLKVVQEFKDVFDRQTPPAVEVPRSY